MRSSALLLPHCQSNCNDDLLQNKKKKGENDCSKSQKKKRNLSANIQLALELLQLGKRKMDARKKDTSTKALRQLDCSMLIAAN